MAKNINYIIFGFLFCLCYIGVSELLYNFAVDIGDKMYLLETANLPFLKIVTIPIALIGVLFMGAKTIQLSSKEIVPSNLSLLIFLITISIVALSYFSGKEFNILIWPIDYDKNELYEFRFNETIMELIEYLLIFIVLIYTKYRFNRNNE